MRNSDVRIHMKLELQEIGRWFNIELTSADLTSAI